VTVLLTSTLAHPRSLERFIRTTVTLRARDSAGPVVMGVVLGCTWSLSPRRWYATWPSC